jgi:D-aminopeptidase
MGKNQKMKKNISAVIIVITLSCLDASAQKNRAGEYGIKVGVLKSGLHNAITDITGVKAVHTTLKPRESINTGVTAKLPPCYNIFQNRMHATIYIGSFFGKFTGCPQVDEDGNIETPVILNNRLSVSFTLEKVKAGYGVIIESHPIEKITGNSQEV